MFVEFFCWFKSTSDVFLAMEYMPLGNLEKNVAASRTVPEAQARDIVGQILLGLEIMHAQSFAHRDLKPQVNHHYVSIAALTANHAVVLKNVLVVHGPPKWLIKLADFGSSKMLTESTIYQTKRGTQPYMAPEIFDYIETDLPRGEYTNAVDLWAVGCITYRIIAGGIPFRPGKLFHYCRDRSQFPSSHLLNVGIRAGSSCSDFIRGLLAADPTKRPSASQALNNWWIVSGRFTYLLFLL